MACTRIFRPSSLSSSSSSSFTRWTTGLRGGLRAVGCGIFGLLLGATAGCAETPTVQYNAAQLIGMWNDAMKKLADQHAGCPYERDLPFNHKKGACYPLKCTNSGDEASLLRKPDGTVYKCDAGCNGGCGEVARF